jgi:hypothetical protein
MSFKNKRQSQIVGILQYAYFSLLHFTRWGKVALGGAKNVSQRLLRMSQFLLRTSLCLLGGARRG